MNANCGRSLATSLAAECEKQYEVLLSFCCILIVSLGSFEAWISKKMKMKWGTFSVNWKAAKLNLIVVINLMSKIS